MPKEFIMRGKTASGTNQVINMGSQARPGYAYRLTEFEIYPSALIGSQAYELAATITADNAEENPSNPKFNHDGLIASALLFGSNGSNEAYSEQKATVVNDLFYITQDLIISCIDTFSGSPMDVNWQCRFVEEKISGSAEAVANYKQYSVYNTSQ